MNARNNHGYAKIPALALAVLMITLSWAGTVAADRGPEGIPVSADCEAGGDEAWVEVCLGDLVWEERTSDYVVPYTSDEDTEDPCINPTGTWICLKDESLTVEVPTTEGNAVTVNDENIGRDVCTIVEQIPGTQCKYNDLLYADSDGDRVIDGVLVDLEGTSIFVPIDA